MKEKYDTPQLLAGLKQHNKEVIHYIYQRYFPMISDMVLQSSSLNKADAEDIFVSALEAIYIKLEDKSFKLDCKFSTFLYSICYRQWCKELNKRNKPIKKEQFLQKNHPELDKTVQNCMEEAEKLALYREKFEELGQQCKRLFQLSFSGYSAKDIVLEMGYKSVSYFYKKKSLCRKKLISLIQQDKRFPEIKD